MNRLQYETSPYLLQHAHNPVDWYSWSEEAFEKAKAEDRPILVSIGYSTCHWCHVMERESFEDEGIARYMNEHFINIKVDREERPDVDQIYMEACQAITGAGGWPLNCFLTPDGRPFYAGTYFPPQPAYQRPSWSQILQGMVDAYHNKREVVDQQAERLIQAVQRADTLFIKEELLEEKEENLFTRGLADQIFIGLSRNFDREDGGFGGAPKFPGAMNMQFLLSYYFHTGKKEALDHVCFSLDKMIKGGIYDQLGGGFARYATDKAWLIPHFEKMLYDNALLVDVLSDVYKLTQKDLYKEAIVETLAFVEREMTSSEGGFYAALDADSEGVEGKFYVWYYEELSALLGKDLDWFGPLYGIKPEGNWEGNNILWRPVDGDPKLDQKIKKVKARLFEERAKRVRPGLDDKILLSWNALMCKAYAKAYQALGTGAYKTIAVRNMDFLLEKFQQKGKGYFFHTYKEGKAKYEAFLDDYAFVIDALLSVYEITFISQYLDKAQEITSLVMTDFLDSQNNLFYFTPAKQKDLPLRRKELYDNATPSGNAVMVENLFRLGLLYERDDLQEQALIMLKRTLDTFSKYPSSFARWAKGGLAFVFPYWEIAVVGPEAKRLGADILRGFIPNKVLMADEKESNDFPILRNRAIGEETNIFVCQNYSCRLPVKTLEEMWGLMKNPE